MKAIILPFALVAFCGAAPPRAMSNLEIYREARMVQLYTFAASLCVKNDQLAFKAVTTIRYRLDAVEGWLSATSGKVAYAKTETDIADEAGTYDPSGCPAKGYDTEPGINRLRRLTVELERRAAVPIPTEDR